MYSINVYTYFIPTILKYITCIILLYTSIICSAQQTFIKTFPQDTLNVYSLGNCLSTNNNYFLFGSFETPVYSSVVIKFNSMHDTLWTIKVDSVSLFNNKGFVPTNDGGCAILGMDRGYQVMLLKIDSTGNVVYKRKYGSSMLQYIIKIIQTSDSGFLFLFKDTQIGNPSFYFTQLVKTDSNGDTLWAKRLNVGYNFGELLEMSSGDILWYGPYTITKISSFGNIILGINVFSGNSFSQLINFSGFINGDLIISGSDGQDSSTIIRIDTLGNYINGIRFENQRINEVELSPNGLIAIMKSSLSDTTSIVGLDFNLQPIFCRKFGVGFQNQNTSSFNSSISAVNDSSYVLTGIREDSLSGYNQGLLMLTDWLGRTSCAGDSGSIDWGNLSMSTIVDTVPFQLETFGHFLDHYPSQTNISVERGIEFYNECVSNSIDQLVPGEIVLYPNPTSGIITLDGNYDMIGNVKVYNVFGQLILEEDNIVFPHSFNLKKFGHGLYFINVIDGAKILSFKVIVN